MEPLQPLLTLQSPAPPSSSGISIAGRHRVWPQPPASSGSEHKLHGCQSISSYMGCGFSPRSKETLPFQHVVQLGSRGDRQLRVSAAWSVPPSRLEHRCLRLSPGSFRALPGLFLALVAPFLFSSPASLHGCICSQNYLPRLTTR